jgi:hypothetical protein
MHMTSVVTLGPSKWELNLVVVGAQFVRVDLPSD